MITLRTEDVIYKVHTGVDIIQILESEKKADFADPANNFRESEILIHPPVRPYFMKLSRFGKSSPQL